MKIKDVTTKIGSGATPTGGESAYKKSGIALIRSQNVLDFTFSEHGLAFIDETQAKKLEGVTVKKGDVLLNITGDSIARCCMAPEKFLPARVNQHVAIIRPKEISPEYLMYYLQYMKPYLMKICGIGGTRNALTKESIEKIPFFKQENEKGIATLLSNIDAKIDNNNAIAAELEGMAKDLYDYWFVQFDFPDENGKPYKSSGGKMVWNEELKREIPEGWEVGNLYSIAPVVTGKEDANFSSRNGAYKFFTCSSDILLCDTPAFSGNAVLVAGNGDFNVKHYSGSFNAYQRTYVLIPYSKDMYAVMYMAVLNQVSSLKKGANGSIVKFITKGDIENISIFVQPNRVLYTQLNTILLSIEHYRDENEVLASLRDFLLPMLMNGQVKVKGA